MTSTWWPPRAPASPRSSGPSPGLLPPGVRGGHRADRGEREHELGQPGAVVLLHRAAGLRVHLPVRRRVHHLQHVLDHRRAADAGAGPAADRRREPPSGVPFRTRRGGHRRARLLGDRAGPRRAGRARARGAAARVRDHAADRIAGVRAADRRGRARRRRRRDGRGRGRPGPQRRAHPPGRRARRSSVRRRRLAAAPVRLGHGRGPGRRGPAGHRAGQAGHRTRGRGRGRHLRRRGHAVPGDRAAAVQRDRASAGPAARGTGQARAGELHAQPPAHRPDRLGAHGRPGPGRRDVGIRRLGVQVGHQQRRRGDQRRPARDGQRDRDNSASRCRPRPRPCRASP